MAIEVVLVWGFGHELLVRRAATAKSALLQAFQALKQGEQDRVHSMYRTREETVPTGEELWKKLCDEVQAFPPVSGHMRLPQQLSQLDSQSNWDLLVLSKPARCYGFAGAIRRV